MTAQGTDEAVAIVRKSETGSYWIDWLGMNMSHYAEVSLYARPSPAEAATVDRVKALVKEWRGEVEAHCDEYGCLNGRDTKWVYQKLATCDAIDAALNARAHKEKPE